MLRFNSIRKFLSTMVILFVFISCNLDDNFVNPTGFDDLNGKIWIEPKQEHVKIAKDVIKNNFSDSITEIKAYLDESLIFPENKTIIDTSEIFLEVYTENQKSVFVFSFFSYAKGYGTICKNGKVIFTNEEFPDIPNPEQLFLE